MKKVVVLFAALSGLVLACGNSTSSDGGAGGAHGGAGGAHGGAGGAHAGSGGSSAGSGGSHAGAGGSSAGASGGGPLACGSQTCGATQYCVTPCCGGAAPGCMMKPDGGTCPVGTHPGCTFGGQCTNPNDCCEFDPCTPAPPYCSDTQPAGCLFEGRMCTLACA